MRANDAAPGLVAMLSQDFEVLSIPGIVVEIDAELAESMGAFEEAALSEADAWNANADLGAAPR